MLLALITAQPVRAQLNETDTLKLHLKGTVSGSVLAGNISRTLLLNRLDAVYAQPGWGFAARADYQYGSTRHRRTENDLDAWNFLYLRPLSRAYPYAMLLVETNFRRKVESRVQPGLGLSYSLLHRQQNLLRLSLTASWERTRYGGTQFENHSDTTANVIETWRATGRLFGRHHLAHDRLRLRYEVWCQQSVEDRANYRYRAEGGAEVPVSKHVALRATARYSYEHVVLAGFRPDDLFVTYGLTFSNF